MAHLTTPVKYDIKDSNIALLGSDLEKRVREAAGDKEIAWKEAGQLPGVQVWRIEKFAVVDWPKERIGSFYDGDSYIVLHTYKKSPEVEALSYDLHFWLGENTSQDEAGTAAYKTVELDDHLHGLPVQYREVQGYESAQFLSYFTRFVCLHGGVSTGFHHVTAVPPPDLHKLYRISLSGRSNLVVHEVPAVHASLVEGDTFVLDKGTKVWQFNTKASAGKEKFKAAEFVQTLVAERQSQCEVTVYDEGGAEAGVFLSEFGEGAIPFNSKPQSKDSISPALFRLSDSSGDVSFVSVPPTSESLSSEDAFLLDDSQSSTHPTIYVWLGSGSSLTERRLAVQYAQEYLYNKKEKEERVQLATSIVKMDEGRESEAFLQRMS